MADKSAQERTEEATPKRREDSRKKGQVPRSKELNTFTSLIAGGATMLVFGPQVVDKLNELLIKGLSFGHEEAFSDVFVSLQMSNAIVIFIVLLAPVLIVTMLAAMISPISLGGLVFSASLVMPKMERISPMKGIERIFSSKSLLELVKAITKFVLVASVTILVISMVLDQILILSLLPITVALSQAGDLVIWCFFGFSSVLVIVVIMDVPYQLWDYSRQIRMTRQEVKDEMKETEGRPEVKSEIRDRQQQAARQRMMTDVPTADVVITNPTHFAVALRYDRHGSGAPTVVAKGRDLVATRIRELAVEHNVVIFAAPPLARALFVSTDINAEIPANLFLAVAQVLAYVFQLQQFRPTQGKRPKPPDDLSVPQDYLNHPMFGAHS